MPRLASLLLILLVGCDKGKGDESAPSALPAGAAEPAQDRRPAAPAPTVTPKEEVTASAAGRGASEISETGVGRIDLGADASKLGALTDMRVEKQPNQNQGVIPDYYNLYRGETRELVISAGTDGKVRDVLVLAGDWSTAEGAALGHTAASLESIHGKPKQEYGSEGELCVETARAGRIEFCFSNDTEQSTWKKVKAENREISRVRIPPKL